MKKQYKWLLSTAVAVTMLTGIVAGTQYTSVFRANTTSYDDGEISIKNTYNKQLTREEIIGSLVNFDSIDQSINKSFFSSFIDLNQFPSDTTFSYLEDKINYQDEELKLTFLSNKFYDENKVIINEYKQFSILLKIKLPYIEEIETKTKYDKSLNKYEVLDALTGDFSTTDKIKSDVLFQYINRTQFPKDAEFNLIYNKPNSNYDKLEIGIETTRYYDANGEIINENKPYYFEIDASISKATKIIENNKYEEETKTLNQIKNFLLENPSSSKKINIKNLSKYLILENVGESTNFYLDKISLKNGYGGFVHVELSYDNYFDNSGNLLNESKTFKFMVLTTVNHNASSMVRNKNTINPRGYQSTLNFLMGDISGDDISGDGKTLDRENLSQWFTLRNIPNEAIFTLESYKYVDEKIKDKVEISFSVDKYHADNGEIIDNINSSELFDDESNAETSKYQSIATGIIPIHIENTAVYDDGLKADEKTVYELEQSLSYYASSNERISYSKLKEYITITDIPSNTKFYLKKIIKNNEST
ncbi:MAG: hypothetical protein ACRC4L_02415, partial [Mycoplasma sp.]